MKNCDFHKNMNKSDAYSFKEVANSETQLKTTKNGRTEFIMNFG